MIESKVKDKRSTFLIELLDMARIILICFVAVFICTKFLFKPVKVDGQSMHPTLQDKEYGFSNVFSALRSDFGRFDVVVVNGPSTDGNNWVKRVIGMPNETIEYRSDKLYINGKYIKEPFLNKEYIASQTKDGNNFTNDFGPISLGNSEYFVMGDNRRVSHDSRAVGAFTGEDIISKSVLVLYPFDKIGLVNNGTK